MDGRRELVCEAAADEGADDASGDAGVSGGELLDGPKLTVSAVGGALCSGRHMDETSRVTDDGRATASVSAEPSERVTSGSVASLSPPLDDGQRPASPPKYLAESRPREPPLPPTASASNEGVRELRPA